jgi:hypothetical protein
MIEYIGNLWYSGLTGPESRWQADTYLEERGAEVLARTSLSRLVLAGRRKIKIRYKVSAAACLTGGPRIGVR